MGMKTHATTILGVRCRGGVAIGGDGQVTLNNVVMKAQAKKIRTMQEGKILSGFSGAAADAFALYEKFEGKLEQYRGNLTRAAHTTLSARQVVEEALRIASEICIYTNQEIEVQEL
jgi:ATP-dependent protease HslVU (ClpYQ) peptidase subunit